MTKLFLVKLWFIVSVKNQSGPFQFYKVSPLFFCRCTVIPNSKFKYLKAHLESKTLYRNKELEQSIDA